jgi:benzoyl-CoA reductase/2-hydroxyglutaryl-CoA dehydratase subunit BcrC/BadD/HgdB
MKRYIGITSTVPVEVIFAANAIPVDLNNLFISSEQPYSLVEMAEAAGFPRNYCAWIKGIYGVLLSRPEIDTVIGVMQGDCGNTAALMDVITGEGRRVIPFAYPTGRQPAMVAAEIKRLAGELDTDVDRAEAIRRELVNVRELCSEIDEMTWQDGVITGQENHQALVGASDFGGDPAAYASSLAALISQAGQRSALKVNSRLALVGVPPIVSDIYSLTAEHGAAVVYNEVQREFSMPHVSVDLAEQYSSYTYPYGSNARAAEIKRQSEKRRINGIVHYVQSFCYHQLDDIVFRDTFDLPVLRLEADKPGALDARSRLRLEAFIETLGELHV